MDIERDMNDLFVLVLGTLITVFTVSAVIFFAFIFQRKIYRKELQYQEIEKLLKKEELRSAYSFIEGREQERKQISEDLHDNLGSLLATLRLYADRLKEESEFVEVQKLADKIIALIGQTAQETRRISHELGAGNIKSFGLLPAVNDLCEAIRASKKLAVLSLLDITRPVDPEKSLHIYRMIQEMFANTLKHSNARNVRLEITQFPDAYLSIIYEDDGRGFNYEKVMKGMGLTSIQSRANLLSAELAIDAKEGQGTTFNIEIPLLVNNGPHN